MAPVGNKPKTHLHNTRVGHPGVLCVGRRARRRRRRRDRRLSLRRNAMSKVKPIHPGEILLEEFMRPYKLNPHRLAMALRVSAPTIYQIVARKRPISSEMALRLARFFKTTPEFW